MGNLTFGTGNYNQDVPKRVERILRAIRRISAVIMGCSYFATREDIIIWFIIGNAVIDELANLIGEEIKDHSVIKTITSIPLDSPEDTITSTEIIPPIQSKTTE